MEAQQGRWGGGEGGAAAHRVGRRRLAGGAGLEKEVTASPCGETDEGAFRVVTATSTSKATRYVS